MNELEVSQFSDFVVERLESLGFRVRLANPDDLETFPLTVVNNVMQSIKRNDENNNPIFLRFSVSIEQWCDTKHEAMERFQKTNELLRQYNFLMVASTIDNYDEATRKYRYGARYEVNYNGLTNSFMRIM